MAAKGSIATRKLHRSATIGLTATKVGLRHLGHVGKKKFTVGYSTPKQDEEVRTKHEEDIGKTLFKALNQLKGTALKASQILSMEADILPEGIRRELSKACYKATPLNRALVDKVFRDQFTKSPGAIFENFDSKAFAAASLGQVHRAKLASGQDVAVKVQYPGIAASIKSDMKMLGGLLTVISASTDLMPDRNIIDTVLDEIAIQLHREVDYFQEAESLKWFRDKIKDERIIVPEIYDDYSSERILTTQLLTGLHLDEWLATNPSQEAKNAYGQLLFDFFFNSFFELGFVHADPHPGNFLFMENGQLGLLDFGCVRKMDGGFTQIISDYYKFLIHHHTVEPDYEKLRGFYEDLELSKDEMTDEEFRSLLQPQLDIIQKWMIEPYLEEQFNFTNREWPEIKMADTRKITPFMKEINRNLLYFDRTYRGMILLLSKLEATVKTGNKWIGA
ncbi:ABC1 kinase family protein [Kiloniella majae]|uniref:ABC1 kinase family protein n=1 Tax=Kiloniella majae TaxID=1938558 RepID=UPI0015C515B5|nr:AarF/ABC1/UbiB kinase family protein [Kiloniella majae]